MKTKIFYELASEVERTFRVLEADRAEMQNHIDIKGWHSQGLITNEEEKELHILNFKLSRKNR